MTVDNSRSKPNDVYISCGDNEQDWVQEWLCPRLEKEHLVVQVSYELPGGKYRVANISNAIANSQHTVVVLTPEWVLNEWKTFEGALAVMGDLAAHKGQVIPLLLKDCEVPKHIALRQARDFRKAKRRERECQLLIWDIKPPHINQAGDVPRTLMQKALALVWRHPRVATLLSVLMIVLLSALVGLPSVGGWQTPGRIGKTIEPFRLQRVNQVLLLSTFADKIGCDRTVTGDTGLYRKTDEAANWTEINPPNCFTKPNQDPQRATLRAFAFASGSGRIYAATSDVGLLRSDDLGETWYRIEQPMLPISQTVNIAASQGNPEALFVAGQNDGLYRWRADAATWEQLDGQQTCATDPAKSLPPHLKWYALLVNATGIYAGTRYAATEAPPSLAGLYLSQDGGNCWRLIHSSEERYSYHALVQNPYAPDQVLAILYDYRSPYPNPNYLLWMFGPTLKEPIRFSFKSNSPMRSLYIDSSSEPKWYVATSDGKVSRGQIRDPQVVETLPAVTGCLPGCELVPPELAADSQGEMPIILADYNLYHWSAVGWPEALKQAEWVRKLLR